MKKLQPVYRTDLRTARRGTLLVVVLGLLVALFIIGTSFSFVTLSERRAAANYLDRQRALDLALDGIEYSVARLRAEAAVKHYEALEDDHAGVRDGDLDPERYANRPVDGRNPSVTWGRDVTSTSVTGGPDGNWIDFNGDGQKGGEETAFGNDKFAGNAGGEGSFASMVTNFGGDGISMNQVRNRNVARASGGDYGPSGTYEELGDYFRVRTVDAASLLNLNNFRDSFSNQLPEELRGKRFSDVMLVLGEAIDEWVSGGQRTGQNNPFTPEIVLELFELFDTQGGFIQSTDDLRRVYDGVERGTELYELALNFVTVSSWQDPNYRDWINGNQTVEENNNPRNLPDQVRMRAGYSDGSNDGMDGWPDWQPATPSGSGKAPINLNTAPKPVLVALFYGIEARARLLFYQKAEFITESNVLIQQKYQIDVPHMNSGTTDIGRQNFKTINQAGVVNEQYWNPGGTDSLGIFQMVPVGPIGSRYGTTGRTGPGTAAENAGALAQLVIDMRSGDDGPFQSWQDFDARFLRARLLQLRNTDRTNIRVPDLIGVQRGSLQGPDASAISSLYPRDLLPLPDNCEHRANPLKSSDAAMNGADFRAWYWKSVVDMLRAALCPSNITNRYNADYPYHTNVDRMDLIATTAPATFSSMGRYQIVSIGEILAPDRITGRTESGQAVADRTPIAQRKVRAVVEAYSVWRHSSQRDFVQGLDPIELQRQQTSSVPGAQTYTRLTKSNTKSHPFSIDETSMGLWQTNTTDESQLLAMADDAKGWSYASDASGLPAEGRNRWKGHNSYTAASGDFGYVTMNPRDETPFPHLNGMVQPLNFHARFNESLRGRTELINDTDTQYVIRGVASDSSGRDAQWGHIPLETEALFNDFISSATPRQTGRTLIVGNDNAEYSTANAAYEGDEATKYATLVPDGAFMRAGNLRWKFRNSPRTTYGLRGSSRPARIKILRYPNGSHYAQFPFMPIQPAADGADFVQGVRDDRLPPQAWNGSASQDLVRERLHGNPPLHRGYDDHNRAVEFFRQQRANMPYYEGTVDFWIKWDLPPQGSQANNIVSAMGEIDPRSHNFSGLFGATAFGRMRVAESSAGNPNAGDLSTPYFQSDPRFTTAASADRDYRADFEGVQFFVYKEPGGWLRFTRLYFSEAWGTSVDLAGTSSSSGTVQPFGMALRRIVDPNTEFSPYTATNDICNDIPGGQAGPVNNKGFLYSRTDSWIDLNTASYTNRTLGEFVLRPHDWHRFTLSYNSNSNRPYRLWFNGRRVDGVVFIDDPWPLGDLGFRNDGHHVGPANNPLIDQPIPAEDASQPTFKIYRTTTKLLEVNPEDRLTVGCIFRRQLDVEDQTVYNDYFNTGPDTGTDPFQGSSIKPPRPVFKFDSNLVAVANATIDDFRISAYVLDDSQQDITGSQAAVASRYMPKIDPEAGNCFYENGFFPFANADRVLLGQPVRLGTISWTELRPDWDPYTARGLNLHTSSRISMEWAVFENAESLPTGGAERQLDGQTLRGRSADLKNESPTSDDYWARGGMSLRGAKLPSGEVVGALLYRAHFQAGDTLNNVHNVTPYLLDVTVTAMTPPRKLWFLIEH